MNNQHNHTPKNSNTNIQNGRHLNTPVETVNPDAVSFEEGYLHGRASERSLESQEQEVRSEHSAARGLLLGMALTSLVGLTVGAIFYLNQREESPTPTPVWCLHVPLLNNPTERQRLSKEPLKKFNHPAPINKNLRQILLLSKTSQILGLLFQILGNHQLLLHKTPHLKQHLKQHQRNPRVSLYHRILLRVNRILLEYPHNDTTQYHESSFTSSIPKPDSYGYDSNGTDRHDQSEFI
jgi:hypothetical protein